MKKVCRNSIAKGFDRQTQALYDHGVSVFRRRFDKAIRARAEGKITPEHVAEALDAILVRKPSLQ